MKEDDEGCPCIFASTPFNNEWHLNVVWSSQLNAKLKHSILFQQATWDRFVTMIPWKTHLGVPRVLGQQWGGPIFLRGFPILQFGRQVIWSVGPTMRWLNLSSSWFLWKGLSRPLWFTDMSVGPTMNWPNEARLDDFTTQMTEKYSTAMCRQLAGPMRPNHSTWVSLLVRITYWIYRL